MRPEPGSPAGTHARPTALFVGIDIGTSSCKGVVLSLTGEIVASAEARHGTDSPRSGWYEHDADAVWWEGSRRVLRSLTAQIDGELNRIAAVGVSGLGANLLPVDVDGHPLRPAILYGIDGRAAEQIDELRRHFGDRRIAENGNPVSTQSVGAKLLWFRQHEPELFARTHKVLGASGYLVYRLTNRMTLDHNEASFYSPFYRLAEQAWDGQALAEFDIDPAILPETLWSTAVVGHITPEVSIECGLPVGVPVCAGKLDHPAERLLASGQRETHGILGYGSSLTISAVTKRLLNDPRLVCMNHCVPGLFSAGGAMSSAGSLMKWFTDEFCSLERERSEHSGTTIHEQLSESASRLAPGSGGLVVLPYFVGERTPMWDLDARGVVLGLTLRTTKAHVYRAILEGVAYGIRQHLDILRELGIDPSELTATGGGTENRLWLQIVSDVSGKPQKVLRVKYPAAVGDAVLAAYATHHITDLNAAIAGIVGDMPLVNPSMEAFEAYKPYYEMYGDLYPATRAIVHRVSRLDRADGQPP